MSNEGIDALRKWREEGGFAKPGPAKTPWQRLDENPRSMRRSINAFCANCMGWERDGERPPGIIALIRECAATRCALHGLRPYQTKDDSEDTHDEPLL